MLYAIAQVTGYLIVGVVTAVIPLGSAYLAVRATKQAKSADTSTKSIELALSGQGGLIKDLQTDRDKDREEIAGLRQEVEGLKVDLKDCETQRARLTERVAELERSS